MDAHASFLGSVRKQLLLFTYVLFLMGTFLPGESVKADIGPKPSAVFYFDYKTKVKPTILEIKVYQCHNSTCSTYEEFPFPIDCEKDICFSYYFIHRYDHFKLAVTFDDRVLTSNVFTKTGFSASYRVKVFEDKLSIIEIYSLNKVSPVIYLCFAVALIWTELIEIGTAVILLTLLRIPKKFLAWVFLANLLSLTIIWLPINYLFLGNELSFFIISELFAFSFEAIFLGFAGRQYNLSMKRAALLSLITNTVSILFGFILWKLVFIWPPYNLSIDIDPILSILKYLAFTILICLFLEWLAEVWTKMRHSPPGQMAIVSGRRVHLVCEGERRPGRPIVILEAGLGNWSFFWRSVTPAISQLTRVCSYDRPGFGWSEPTRAPRNPARIAYELHTALQDAGEPGPYILVGHSLGGIFVRQFARHFPGQVKGMILIDSAHEDQISRMPWARREARGMVVLFTIMAVIHRLGVLRLMGKLLLRSFSSIKDPKDKKQFLSTLLASRYFETTRAESQKFIESSGPLKGLLSLGNITLIVIQAGGKPEKLPRGYTLERWQQERQAWDQIQRDLLKLSTDSCLIIAEKSIHSVQSEQPEVVIDAVKQMLDRLNTFENP